MKVKVSGCWFLLFLALLGCQANIFLPGDSPLEPVSESKIYTLSIEFDSTLLSQNKGISITTEEVTPVLDHITLEFSDLQGNLIIPKRIEPDQLSDSLIMNFTDPQVSMEVITIWQADGTEIHEWETKELNLTGLQKVTIRITPPEGIIVNVEPDSGMQTLTMGVFGDMESGYKAVIESSDFQQKFPNVTIELQPADFGGHHNRLVTQLAAGSGANDIEAVDIGYIARFVADGGLTDLSTTPYNGFTAGEDLVDFGMSNATTIDEKLMAMPVDIAPAVMYYRKSIIDDAGLEMDNILSWDEYIENGIKLTVDKDADGTIDQYAVTHPGDVAMIPLNGGKGDWFENGAPYEPKARFTAVLELVRDIREAGIDANFTPWSGEWINAFKDDKVVTMFSGSWLSGHFKNWMCPELAGDWRVAFPPGKTYSSYGGSFLSIPEQTADSKKGIAWEVIKYFTTDPDAQLLIFQQIDAFPALSTVFSNEVMDEPVDYFGGQKVRQIYREIGMNIPVQKVSEYDAIAADIFNKAIDAVVSDGVSVETAYDNAKNEMLGQM